jgi:hypothetical protein
MVSTGPCTKIQQMWILSQKTTTPGPQLRVGDSGSPTSTLALAGWWWRQWARSLDLGFGWVVEEAVGSVGVWGVWVGPGMVWMGCVVFAVELLWGGYLLMSVFQPSQLLLVRWVNAWG